MATPLRVLLIEDSEDDAELAVRELRHTGYDVAYRRVETPEALRDALESATWDLVISDYSMPHLDGLAAFDLVQHFGVEIPFIFLSGTIGEERAAEAMKRGVHDYVLKGNMARLVPAIKRELREAELRRMKKETEEALRHSEAQYRAIVEDQTELICRLRPDGTLTFVNEACCRYYGQPREELLKRDLLTLVAPESRDEVLRTIESLVAEPLVIEGEYEVVLENGQRRWLAATARPILDASGTVIEFQAVGRDVTERRRTGEANRRLLAAIEQAAEIIWMTDPEGVIEYVNPATTTILGYDQSELIGRHAGTLSIQTQDESYVERLMSALRRGDVWRDTLTFLSKPGAPVYMSAALAPVLDANGQMVGTVNIMRDMTTENRLQAALRQAQRMEAIATLAGGIAHDFNNILSALIGYADLAKKAVGKGHPADEYLDHVQEASRRAADLVRQILTFSRGREEQFDEVQVHLIITEALKLLRASLPSSIEIVESLDVDCDPIWGDVTQIHQVVMNLCTNAYHAMRPKGGS
jgi:PAS domain S-box-containing protein